MSLDIESARGIGGGNPNGVAGGHGWALHQELKRQAEQIATLHAANNALVERARMAERRATPIRTAALDQMRTLLNEALRLADDDQPAAVCDLLNQILGHGPTDRAEIEEVADFFRRR